MDIREKIFIKDEYGNRIQLSPQVCGLDKLRIEVIRESEEAVYNMSYAGVIMLDFNGSDNGDRRIKMEFAYDYPDVTLKAKK